MCGIAGIISENDVDINFFNNLLLSTMERGEDATGIWTEQTGVIKDGIRATAFIQKYKKDYSTKTNIIIGHCRKSSGSKADNNNNNHPFEDTKGILIHNGSVDRMDKIEDYIYKGDCDSEVLLSHITTNGIPNGLKEVQGSAAVAYINNTNKSEIFLWRDTNPIVVAFNIKTKTIVFASTEEIIQNSLPSIFGLFTSPLWLFKKLPEYAVYKVGINLGKLYMNKVAFIKPEFKPYVWKGHKSSYHGI